MPEVVKDSNDRLSVVYDKISPYLVEAIKEQNSGIKILEARVKLLESFFSSDILGNRNISPIR
jgi:hypothetical protein